MRRVATLKQQDRFYRGVRGEGLSYIILHLAAEYPGHPTAKAPIYGVGILYGTIEYIIGKPKMKRMEKKGFMQFEAEDLSGRPREQALLELMIRFPMAHEST